jgi:hypothetical protein
LKEKGDVLSYCTHVAMINPDLWCYFTELYLCRDFGHLPCLAMNEKGDMEKAGDAFGVSHMAMNTPTLAKFYGTSPVQGLWPPVLPGHE